MLALSILAVSCVDGPKGVRCPECERLEGEFLDVRNRLWTLKRLRQLTPVEEKRLIDRAAMAVAQIKEHETAHAGERCKKGTAAG
jgi:hypothetical protein